MAHFLPPSNGKACNFRSILQKSRHTFLCRTQRNTWRHICAWVGPDWLASAGGCFICRAVNDLVWMDQSASSKSTLLLLLSWFHSRPHTAYQQLSGLVTKKCLKWVSNVVMKRIYEKSHRDNYIKVICHKYGKKPERFQLAGKQLRKQPLKNLPLKRRRNQLISWSAL